jgi:hypothetical protein
MAPLTPTAYNQLQAELEQLRRDLEVVETSAYRRAHAFRASSERS